MVNLAEMRAAVKLQRRLDVAVADAWDPAANPPEMPTVGCAGVVVGVVDSGVDALHADFFDTATNQTRVTHYWDQNSNVVVSDGLPASVEAHCATNGCDCDPSAVGHGTHVATTAAGRFGQCPGAQIIAVATTMFTDAIVDGVNWIFQMAAGTPAVINLSLGGHFGPHDGTDIMDIGLDEAIALNGAQAPGL